MPYFFQDEFLNGINDDTQQLPYACNVADFFH